MCHLLLALPLPMFWICPLSVALPAYGAAAGFSAVIYWYAIQAMNRPIQNGAEGMVSEIGEVIENSAYAEAMTYSDRRSEPALIARLRQVFSDDAIIELAALIANQNLSSKFNAALGVPAEGFCEATRTWA
jgi:hypothetical protein